MELRRRIVRAGAAVFPLALTAAPPVPVDPQARFEVASIRPFDADRPSAMSSVIFAFCRHQTRYSG